MFEVEDGAHLVPGDAIRFVLDTGGGRYLLVISVDGAGQLNVYPPLRWRCVGSDRRRHPPHHRRRQHRARRRARPERIWAVISDRIVTVAELRAQLAEIQAGGASAVRLGAQLVISDARQVSMWFEKPPAPASIERTP